MAAMQKLENPNNLAALLQGGSSLLSLFAPKKTTTGPTSETQQTNLSMEGLDAVLRQILESNQGLASVARGQRNAGLYNSSANTLLTNDLITRAAGEVAKINAPITRTSTGQRTVQEAPLSISKGLGTIAAGTLVNNILKSDTVKNFGSKALDSFLGGGGGSLGGGITAGASGAGGIDVSSIFGGIGSGIGGGSLGSGISLGGSGASIAGGFSPASAAASIFDIFTSDDPGAAAERGIGQAVGGFFGGPIGAAFGGAVAEPVFEVGYDILGGVEQLGGNLVEGVGDLISGVFGGGCFITTATVKLMGKKDDCEELTVLRSFRDSWLKENHPEDIDAYYEIAPKILTALSSMPHAQEILEQTYALYIAPAVEAVKEGENAIAYELYKNMVLMLSKTAGLASKEVTA